MPSRFFKVVISFIYIGPMDISVEDFWRMIWEYKMPTVVMLTRCNEGKVQTCLFPKLIISKLYK